VLALRLAGKVAGTSDQVALAPRNRLFDELARRA
jgi:hypothetical protein